MRICIIPDEHEGNFHVATTGKTGDIILAAGHCTHLQPESPLPKEAAIAIRDAIAANTLVGGVVRAVAQSALQKLYKSLGILAPKGTDYVECVRAADAKLADLAECSLVHVAVHVCRLQEIVVAAVGDVGIRIDDEDVVLVPDGRITGGTMRDGSTTEFRRKLYEFKTLELRARGTSIRMINDGEPALIMEEAEAHPAIDDVSGTGRLPVSA